MPSSLEPPSPASSPGPREVEHSLQTTPQLPGVLSMTSSPESYPEKHHDAAESPRVAPVSKRWFQTRFKKAYRNQASQPPDQLSTKSSRPANLCNSQSQLTANIAKEVPSRMAAAQRVRVSGFSFGRKKVFGLSDETSQRTVAKPVNWVRCSVCLLVPLFILRDSVTAISRLPKRAIRSRARPVADKGLQVERKGAPCVSFQ